MAMESSEVEMAMESSEVEINSLLAKIREQFDSDLDSFAKAIDSGEYMEIGYPSEDMKTSDENQRRGIQG